MKNPNKKITIVLLLFAFLITSGAKCGGLPNGAIKEGSPDPITINYWSVSWNDNSATKVLLQEYSKKNPHVQIKYRQETAAQYNQALITSFAKDNGPDIFSVHTTAMKQFIDYLSPLPEQITTQSAFESGTFKKQIYTKANIKNTLSLNDLKTLFPDVVTDNQVINNKIYGLPLSIDTLVLYYNRDLLNNAGIQTPPADWETFKQDAISMTKQNDKGEIVQSGGALGTSNNISRATDILSLLFYQSGHPIAYTNGRTYLNANPSTVTGKELIAANALNFYNSFASPSNENFIWDADMPNALEAFGNGTIAFYLGYAYEFNLIKTQYQGLKFDIAPVPQLTDRPVNFANYWAEGVSKKSKYKDVAWDIILFMATNEEANKKYLTTADAKKPAALRSLLNVFEDDLYFSAFGKQTLTAKSWYKGAHPEIAEQALKNLIKNNLAGTKETKELLADATSQINGSLAE
ncbi:MAG: extracellular solute-binding protein [Candidatus Parcubacteria bacterium]|nr:extracellular solute-binding protein [Candidatus Parcubacteria bacterium]